MEDKDRLGDKLREKGKAEEDQFIAEQERKRLERRKQAEAAAAGSKPLKSAFPNASRNPAGPAHA